MYEFFINNIFNFYELIYGVILTDNSIEEIVIKIIYFYWKSKSILIFFVEKIFFIWFYFCCEKFFEFRFFSRSDFFLDKLYSIGIDLAKTNVALVIYL